MARHRQHPYADCRYGIDISHRHARHATGRARDEKGCRSIELIIFVPLHPMLINIATMREIWALVNEVSPYLLLGFAFAGLLHSFVPTSLYRRYLGHPQGAGTEDAVALSAVDHLGSLCLRLGCGLSAAS